MMDERRLIIVEDDARFAPTLQRSFERRGYRVWIARTPAALEALLEEIHPQYAVVDLKLGTESGLVWVRPGKGTYRDIGFPGTYCRT